MEITLDHRKRAEGTTTLTIAHYTSQTVVVHMPTSRSNTAGNETMTVIDKWSLGLDRTTWNSSERSNGRICRQDAPNYSGRRKYGQLQFSWPGNFDPTGS